MSQRHHSPDISANQMISIYICSCSRDSSRSASIIRMDSASFVRSKFSSAMINRKFLPKARARIMVIGIISFASCISCLPFNVTSLPNLSAPFLSKLSTGSTLTKPYSFETSTRHYPVLPCNHARRSPKIVHHSRIST